MVALAIDYDANARLYLASLQAGQRPDIRPDCGRWSSLVSELETVFERTNGSGLAVQHALIPLKKKHPDFAEIFSSAEPLPELEIKPEEICPPLPDGVALPPDLATGASPCLDEYVAYSRDVSPEGFADFHEAAFLWLASVIAARRVKIPLNHQYTPLMIALVARTSLYAKTSTADVAISVLQACGLRWFLGADETTPQKLLSDMVGAVPANYGDLDFEKQDRIKLRLAMSGQRGWYYDEFGELVKSLTKANGIMSDFKGLLLKLDNCADQYEYATQKRGNEIIEKPYLALLGSMTPASMRLSGKSGSELWSDGFWARMVFVCPPEGTGLDIPYSIGDKPVPFSLREKLRKWHHDLGMPDISIEAILDDKGRPTGRYTVEKGDLPEHTCTLGDGVRDAWVRYRSALKDLLKVQKNEDFDGSYNRLATKAMRIAALLASLENDGLIEIRHWAKAQEIAERWRLSLHQLYSQVNTQTVKSDVAKLEDEIIRHLKRLAERDLRPSSAELKTYMPNVSRKDIEDVLHTLSKAGVVAGDKTERTTRWHLADLESNL
jgi:hypothetical protein